MPRRHRDAPPEDSLYGPIEWEPAASYEDLIYERAEGLAKITINRPEVRNAFRPQTIAELRDAFARARDDIEVGAVIFTGAGNEAFCAGGDQRIRGDDGYIGDDEVAQRGVGRLDEVAAAMSIITSDDLRRFGAMTLPQALRLAESLHASQSSGAAWAISPRGFNIGTANKMLVMIDGRTVYSPVYGGVFWDAQDIIVHVYASTFEGLEAIAKQDLKPLVSTLNSDAGMASIGKKRIDARFIFVDNKISQQVIEYKYPGDMISFYINAGVGIFRERIYPEMTLATGWKSACSHCFCLVMWGEMTW